MRERSLGPEPWVGPARPPIVVAEPQTPVKNPREPRAAPPAPPPHRSCEGELSRYRRVSCRTLRAAPQPQVVVALGEVVDVDPLQGVCQGYGRRIGTISRELERERVSIHLIFSGRSGAEH